MKKKENGNATVHVRVLDTRAANGALTLPEPNVIPSSSAVAVWMSERRWWFACESRVHLGVRREKKRIAVDAAIARTAGYKLSYHRSKCRNNQRFRWSFRKFPTVLWKLIAMQGFLVEIHCNYLTATIYGNCKTIEKFARCQRGPHKVLGSNCTTVNKEHKCNIAFCCPALQLIFTKL